MTDRPAPRSGTLNIDDSDFVRRFTWKIWRRGIAGTLIGVAGTATAFAVAVPVYPGGISYIRALRAIATGSGVALIIGLLGAALVDRRLVPRATAWVRDRRPPSPEDMTRVVALPRQAAQLTALLWILATPPIIWYVSTVGYRFDAEVLVKTVLIFGYGALTASLLAYLFVEMTLPTVLVHVLPKNSDEWRRTMGVAPRLILAWLAVAGYPLISFAINITGLDAQQRSRMVSALQIVFILSAAVGFLVFTFAGRTLTLPLEKLR